MCRSDAPTEATVRRDNALQVMTFYRFVPLEALTTLCGELTELARSLALRGTILLASEGINGTLVGSRCGLQTFAEALAARAPFAEIPVKFSSATAGNPVFHRLKVRIKPEIVSFGQRCVSPHLRTGIHVTAARWNQLLDDPEVVVVDARNRYEVAVGTFPGAVDPGTDSFREFPEFVAKTLDSTRPKVAMFCTGGIRCEKASAYLLEQGFSTVYQLDGGILNYLATVDERDNRWRGDCFVFDQRVTLTASLQGGEFQQCFACRRALCDTDRASPDFVPGVSCPHCIDEQSDAQPSDQRWS